MRNTSLIWLGLALTFTACTDLANTESESDGPSFTVVDTDFSKGRLGYEQEIELGDLEKFHGHLCDGLVVGALGMQEAAKALFPEGPIDRTNLRVVSKPSPCLTDVAVYVTGGRYQFGTFYVDTDFEGEYILQRLDNGTAVSVGLNAGVKPSAIDSLGAIAVAGELSPCGIDSLRAMEDKFTETLLSADAAKIFTVRTLTDFHWQPKAKNDFVKTDVVNKVAGPCRQ